MNIFLKLISIFFDKSLRFCRCLVKSGPIYTYKKLVQPKLKWLKIFIVDLQKRGIRYAYNHLYISIFYSPTNPDVIKWIQKKVIYPPYIEIEVSTRCNLKCVMCEHTYWKESGRDMSFDQFKYILDQFPELKWIGLSGIGEAFLNKDFLKMLWLCKSRKIYIELFDGFFLINEKVAQDLVKMQLDKILGSIDAATKETYEKIRPGSDFNKVISNLKYLVELKKRSHKDLPQINLHYIVSKLNLHELPLYVEFMHSLLGPKEINEIIFSRVLHNFKEIQDLYIEVPDEIVSETQKIADGLGINIVWGTRIAQKKPPISECVAWMTPFIFVNGDVVPCCAANEANRREFQKKYSMGNIFQQPFREIWSGKEYNKLRTDIFSDKVPIQCTKCPIFDIKCQAGEQSLR